MIRHRVDLLSLVAWVLSCIPLLLVELGDISPIGIIIVTITQYEWAFWLSALTFLIFTTNLVNRVRHHRIGWHKGFSGEIVRAIRIPGKKKDYFIRGKGETRIKQVLLDDWPFSEYK